MVANKIKTFKLTILSKNKNSLNHFLLFFNSNAWINLNSTKKYSQKHTKIKKFTLLKSPHVNKKAQEQFEYKILKKEFIIQTIKNFQCLIFLKKLSFYLFPDINIKLKHKITNININKLKLKFFNPNNFKTNKYQNFKIINFNYLKKNNNKQKYSLIQKINFLLKIFDLYGEL